MLSYTTVTPPRAQLGDVLYEGRVRGVSVVAETGVDGTIGLPIEGRSALEMVNCRTSVITVGDQD